MQYLNTQKTSVLDDEEYDDVYYSSDDDLEILEQLSLQRFDNKERFSYD